jgi:hypothetical protein
VRTSYCTCLSDSDPLPLSEETTGLSSSPILGPEGSVTTASIIRSGHLPSPQLGIIGEIERAIKALSRTQPVKERICEYIQQEVSFECKCVAIFAQHTCLSFRVSLVPNTLVSHLLFTFVMDEQC